MAGRRASRSSTRARPRPTSSACSPARRARMGIVTWASVKCELLATAHKLCLVPATSLAELHRPHSTRVTRVRLGDEVLLLSAAYLARLLAATTPAADLASLTAALPAWVLVVGLGGREHLAAERVARGRERRAGARGKPRAGGRRGSARSRRRSARCLGEARRRHARPVPAERVEARREGRERRHLLLVHARQGGLATWRWPGRRRRRTESPPPRSASTFSRSTRASPSTSS